MRFTYLSYNINEKTPLYGGEKLVSIEQRSEISKGDSSNTKHIRLPNHTGTHIDFPNHFSNSGKTINDYPASFWQFDKIHVVSYKADSEEIIDKTAFENIDLPAETEFLIISTGFGKYRTEEKYWFRNPGLSPELAEYIRNKCPNIKIVGFDFISVSSFQNRMLGREAHRKFLIEQDILLVEDMKLDIIVDNINRIIALPWQLDFVDGAPITIVAEYE